MKIKARIEHEYAKDPLFCVIRLLEKISAFNREEHILFVDLKEAYRQHTTVAITSNKKIKRIAQKSLILKVKAGSKRLFARGFKQRC